MTQDRLVLPIPPPDNHAYVSGVSIGPGGRPVVRRVRTRRNLDFQEEASWLAYGWCGRSGWSMPDHDDKVVLRYWVYWPDRRRRDPANLLKVLLDALEGVLYADDRTVLPRAMDYQVDRLDPRVEVDVSLFG
ncbi:MAG: RusA family crossover junction endodeoxyribonuclease [Actinomycetota bacterium]|nr:RusA family crossover junction endodeoxyribonuclease [Actinomycetota bacterium]